MLLTDPDGFCHFSTLKQMARSPAHYAWRCAHPMTPTADMLIASAVNQRVLGEPPRNPIKVFEHASKQPRLTNEYKAFVAANPDCTILTEKEWSESSPIAKAVINDPCARELLCGARYEVPLDWTDSGVPCRTTGIDIVGPGYIADLKVVHNAEPEYLMKHALRMSWHAQLVWYRTGIGSADVCSAGILANGSLAALHLLCVESSPPHCVTVLTLSPEVIEAGQKCVRAWMERLKVCAESGVYSGYVQAPVTWALPECTGGV